jgi:DNA modification methylase
MAGDGPTSAADYLIIARPKHRLPPERVGSRPGYYISKHTNSAGFAAERHHPGGKSLGLMTALVRDYSRPDDIVCDPCAGGGTTLLAAVQTGRRAVGSEMDATTFAKATKRLQNASVTVDWLDKVQADQQKLSY